MKETLKTIVSKGEIHAKWLNTLSHLEYIGTRKIIKSQDSKSISFEVLKHIQEESRHALFFKRIVNKHFPHLCHTYSHESLLGGISGEKYFQDVDRFISDQLSHNQMLNYFYVTLIIEERALCLYQEYNEVLKELNSFFNLNALIAEEINHLNDTVTFLEKRDKDYSGRIEKFRAHESILFNKLMALIQSEINVTSVNPERQALA